MTTIAEIDGWKLTRIFSSGPLTAEYYGLRALWEVTLLDTGAVELAATINGSPAKVRLPAAVLEHLLADYERRRAER